MDNFSEKWITKSEKELNYLTLYPNPTGIYLVAGLRRITSSVTPPGACSRFQNSIRLGIKLRRLFVTDVLWTPSESPSLGIWHHLVPQPFQFDLPPSQRIIPNSPAVLAVSARDSSARALVCGISCQFITYKLHGSPPAPAHKPHKSHPSSSSLKSQMGSAN